MRKICIFSKNSYILCYVFFGSPLTVINKKMTENNNLDFLGGFGEAIKTLIENEVRKCVNVVFEEYDSIRRFEHSTISSDELCKRWNRCKNSLRNLEKEGIIAPLPVGGKTKVYSMTAVLEAEQNNPKLNNPKLNRAA